MRRSLFIILSILIALPLAAQPLKSLPFVNAAAIIYDNDDHRDVYTDEYLLALAHLGEINLAALITTYSPNQHEYNEFVEGRRKIVEKARETGFRNLPKVFEGADRPLDRPSSNRIKDTEPIDLTASRFIINQARHASIEKPLIYVAGNQLTTLANAYLIDPSISDRVLVSTLVGVRQRDYHVGLDDWAWSIVLSFFRVLAIPVGPPNNRGTVYMKPPSVPKKLIAEALPQELPLFRWMFEKEHPTNWLPAEHDYDGQVAIPLTRPDYITKLQRWRATGIDSGGRLTFKKDESGNVYEALDAEQEIATEEFWRVMKGAANLLSF